MSDLSNPRSTGCKISSAPSFKDWLDKNRVSLAIEGNMSPNIANVSLAAQSEKIQSAPDFKTWSASSPHSSEIKQALETGDVFRVDALSTHDDIPFSPPRSTPAPKF